MSIISRYMFAKSLREGRRNENDRQRERCKEMGLKAVLRGDTRICHPGYAAVGGFRTPKWDGRDT
jgi:hypothetical protein